MLNAVKSVRQAKENPMLAAARKGPSLGVQIGGALGGLAEKVVGKVFGMGDYDVVSPDPENLSSNSLVGKIAPDVIPMMHGKDGVVRVQHREYLRDINMSTAAQSGYYVLNPGDAGTFPWLSNIATAFEQWLPLGILIEFRTLSANAVASTNAALGSLSMATQYDVMAPRFGNKQQLLQYYFSTSAIPSASILHAVECKPEQTPIKPLFIRKGNTQQTTETKTGGGVTATETYDAVYDARLYDLGRFEYITQGAQSNYTGAGELWITYDIVLMKPRNNGSTSGFTYTNDYQLPDSSPPNPVFLPEVVLAATDIELS
jgi:hypothetical protein